jgi:multiple antibiotic resistance protein
MNPSHALERLLHTLPNAATATFLALFPIVNPFGGIPMFFALTENFTRPERNRTALKVSFWVFVILLVFMLFGRFVLSLFGISLPVLKIAGGLIVANTAWGMVTASSRLTVAESADANTKEDISLTPMAMPLLSGPGSIGVVMGLAANVDSLASYVGIVIGICALAITVYLFLRMGGPFVGRLGPNAVGAITRIFGFLILAIAVQLVADGVVDFMASTEARQISRQPDFKLAPSKENAQEPPGGSPAPSDDPNHGQSLKLLSGGSGTPAMGITGGVVPAENGSYATLHLFSMT